MRARGFAALAAVLAVGGGGTALAAFRLPSGIVAPSGRERMTLPGPGVAATPVCPGPEALLTPVGGTAEGLGGLVAVAGVTDGRAAVLADRLVPLSSSGFGVLSVGRSVAGAVTLREPAGAAESSGGAAARLNGHTVGNQALPGPGQTTQEGPAGRGDDAGQAAGSSTSLAQFGLTRGGDLRGLSAAACSAATTQSWLVGGGTQPGRRGRLLLTNPAPAPATVDVTVYGPLGQVPAPGGSGVVVPAKGQTALLVEALAPAGLDGVAVHVVARSGRVSAVLQDAWVRGVTPGGVDDVTASAAPSRTQFVPGIAVSPPAGLPLPPRSTDPSAVAVRIVNPGPGTAVVRVRLVGAAGTAVLPHGVVTVAPGAVADVPVTQTPAGSYTAIVDADVPVVSSALVGRGVAGSAIAGTAAGLTRVVPPSEFGWAPSVEPLAVSAVAPLPAFTESGRRTPVTATLTLAAPDVGGRAEVVEIDGHGAVLRTSTVTVVAGTSLERTLAPAAAGVRIQPAPGAELVAAVILAAQDSSGPLVSVLPVRSGPAGTAGSAGTAGRPEVVPDARVGLRG